MINAKQVKSIKPFWEIAGHFNYNFHQGYRNHCPFCKKDNLAVNESNIYCFQAGCVANKKSMDIFNLLVNDNKANSFVEALNLVKQALGLKEDYSISYQYHYSRQELLKKAFLLYNRNLNSKSIEYLVNRKFKKSLWHIYVGYAGESNFLQQRGFSKQQLETAGLLSKAGGELFYDHVIFAFIDQHDNITHLQGRNLSNSEARWINSRSSDDESISKHLFNLNNATDENIFLTEGVTDGITLMEVFGEKKVISCVGVHPKLLSQLEYFKYKTSLTAIFDNDRFDFNNSLQGELKSWKGILSALIKLKSALPELTIYCLYPPDLPNVKDVNDWFIHYHIDPDYIRNHRKRLIDFTFKHYPNKELDGLILKNIASNYDSYWKSRLNDRINEYEQPLDYILSLLKNNSINFN